MVTRLAPLLLPLVLTALYWPEYFAHVLVGLGVVCVVWSGKERRG